MTWTETVVWIAGILVALGVIWKPVKFVVALLWGWVTKMAKSIKFINSLEEDIKGWGEKLDMIYTEFQPNGGESMKDALNRIEDHLAVSDSRELAILAETPKGLFEADVSGSVRYCNRTLMAWTGMSSEETIGHGWINGVCPTSRDEVYAEWKESIEQQREMDLAVNLVSKSGTEHAVKMHSFPLRDRAQNVRLYFVTFTVWSGKALPLVGRDESA